MIIVLTLVILIQYIFKFLHHTLNLLFNNNQHNLLQYGLMYNDINLLLFISLLYLLVLILQYLYLHYLLEQLYQLILRLNNNYQFINLFLNHMHLTIYPYLLPLCFNFLYQNYLKILTILNDLNQYEKVNYFQSINIINYCLIFYKKLINYLFLHHIQNNYWQILKYLNYII